MLGGPGFPAADKDVDFATKNMDVLRHSAPIFLVLPV
jgi:hypothetical protein